MGIVQRQGMIFTVISYAGALIGAVNTLFLYPALLNTSEIGVLGLLISFSVIYAQLSQIGIPTIFSRFFPEFRTADTRHHGFLTWIILVTGAGFLIISTLFLILLNPFRHLYAHSPEFTSHISLVIPLAGFTLCYAVLDTVTRAIYKSILSSFLNSFVLKLSTSLGIILYYYHFIDFSGFLNFYVAINGLICLAILLQLVLSGEFSFTLSIQISGSRTRELLRFGLFTVLSGSTYVFLQKMDIQILGIYTRTGVVGAYLIYLNIVSFILIPSQAINRVAYQIVADAWVKKDMQAIASIYKKTSIVQMIFGCLLFIGIVLNKENLLTILKKPEYRTQFPAFYLLALATLIDLTGGLNTYIIAVSHKYKVSTFIVVLSMLLCIGFNFIFVPGIGRSGDLLYIPALGAVGAGLSLFLAYTFMNVSNWLYLKVRFSLQPFDRKHFILLGISILTFSIFSFLPVMGPLVIDMVIRSGLITLFFGTAVLMFRISEDVNRFFEKLILRFK